jgi:hypothetical protein
MLNPKKGTFSEMVKIPHNEIEAASKIQFSMTFPTDENGVEPGPTSSSPLPNQPRKRAKLSSQNSESGAIAEKLKRNRTKLAGPCIAVMELGFYFKVAKKFTESSFVLFY